MSCPVCPPAQKNLSTYSEHPEEGLADADVYYNSTFKKFFENRGKGNLTWGVFNNEVRSGPLHPLTSSPRSPHPHPTT